MNGILLSEKSKKNTLLILCCLSFLAAVFYNELNLQKLPAEYVREGGTVITNDDASYLNPPREFLKGKGWGEDYWGAKIGSFIRPPGYGALYLPFYKFFGPVHSVTVLKFFQYSLFAFSVYWFCSVLMLLTTNVKWAFIGAAFYGCSPFLAGFLSYTLTEGITPQLMILYLFLLLKARHDPDIAVKNKYFFLAALLFAFIFIVRPVLGVFGLLLPVFLVFDFIRISVRGLLLRLVIFGVIATSMMSIWQIRNYKIAGEYVGLHPVYYKDGNTAYRTPFRSYWAFAGCWAEKGDKGFSYMMPMWEAAINGDTSIMYVNNAIDSLPAHVVSFYGRERLKTVFKDYQSAVLYQKSYYDKKLAMPVVESAAESSSVNDFIQLRNEYRSEFPLRYYILSPAKVFGFLAFHSNLSLYIFQKAYRGMWWMEFLRFIFFSIHGLCFLCLFYHLLRIKRSAFTSLLFGWIPLIYLFYLCFVQRGVEERYTLPLLPILLAGSIQAVFSVKENMRVQKVSSTR